MTKKLLSLISNPVKFGTDGWRGVLGVDFTLERLLPVVVASAQELAYISPPEIDSRKIIIGYDRRFLAYEMAETIASAIRACDLEPLLADSSVPTPACSWAVVNHQALGALVITASHNPPEWLGLKIKSYLGGSVEGDFTKAVEKRLELGSKIIPIEGKTPRFDCRKEHLNYLRSQFDINSIVRGIEEIGLKIIVDPMHGSAAGCIRELLGEEENGFIQEIRSSHDPFFGGNPPEPLAKYINQLIDLVKDSASKGKPALGLVFDGDGDRIAAVDEDGSYCSTQLLIPLLIDHLVRVKNYPGCIVKTVSGCDLMRLVAEDLGRDVLEMPVGFKYIAKEMLSKDVLIGGEESGGIGFGFHIPERDALFTSLVLLEAISSAREPLGKKLNSMQNRFGKIYFDRIDIILDNMEFRKDFEINLKTNPPNLVAGKNVKEFILVDGVKLRLDLNHWLMFRFSGTEPLLRIYCEGPSEKEMIRTLDWARDFVEKK